LKLFSRTKREIEIVCALIKDGCDGRTEFRPEFEVFLCDTHHRWAVKKKLINQFP
jgi:hypothetical protein